MAPHRCKSARRTRHLARSTATCGRNYFRRIGRATSRKRAASASAVETKRRNALPLLRYGTLGGSVKSQKVRSIAVSGKSPEGAIQLKPRATCWGNANRFLQAPKGRSNSSPGQRPGTRDPIPESPEGAFQSQSAVAACVARPFRAFLRLAIQSQGVALGSSWVAPLALENTRWSAQTATDWCRSGVNRNDP